MRKIEYEEAVKRMLILSLTAIEIAEKLNCSIPTVYRYAPKGFFRRPEIDGMLFCRRCKQYYSVDNFNIDKHNKTGRQSICKECNKEQAKNRREKLKNERI